MKSTLDQPKHSTFTRKLRNLAGVSALAGLLFASQNAIANEPVKIFEQPPTAAELADMLFPMTYRAIVFNSDTPVVEAPSQSFGMLINFEYDSTVIVGESLPYLDSVGQMLNMDDLQNSTVMIEGHTDAAGSDVYNMTLSQKRAIAVKQYLVGVYNIHPDRLLVNGKGEQELHNETDPSAAINRRVQFSAVN